MNFDYVTPLFRIRNWGLKRFMKCDVSVSVVPHHFTETWFLINCILRVSFIICYYILFNTLKINIIFDNYDMHFEYMHPI